MWPLIYENGQVEKVCENQAKVEFAKDAPPICCSQRDTQPYLQHEGEIPTHGRENEIVNLQFTHDGTKFFDSGA